VHMGPRGSVVAAADLNDPLVNHGGTG
jgi:hypothetical protein